MKRYAFVKISRFLTTGIFTMRFLKLILLAFAVSFFAPSARADAHTDPGDWTLSGSPFGVPVLVDTNIYSGPVGLLQGWEATDATATTGVYDYYTVFDASASGVQTYGYFDQEAAPEYFSAGMEDQIGRLLSLAQTLDTSNPKRAQSEAASVQLALWNIIFDTDMTVLQGAFRTINGQYAAAASPEALFADQLLAQATTTPNVVGPIEVKHLIGAQDVIVFDAPVPTVPELSTQWLLILGLTLFLLNRRWSSDR